MSINYAGVQLTGQALKEAEASGYGVPGIVVVSDTTIVDTRTLDIIKSTVENADPALTWQAIYTELDVFGTALSSFYDATNTVDSYGSCSRVDLVTDPKYGNNATVYRCAYTLYTKVTV